MHMSMKQTLSSVCRGKSIVAGYATERNTQQTTENVS